MGVLQRLDPDDHHPVRQNRGEPRISANVQIQDHQRDVKVLVTGAAGFIGSHLTERLVKEGYEVLGVDIKPLGPRQAVDGAEVDIRDENAMLSLFEAWNPYAVIHLAAMTGVRASMDNPTEYSDVNVTGTFSLLRAAARHQLGHFLLASSSSVYGNHSRRPQKESYFVDHPISPYAATKRMAELAAVAYHEVFGLPVTCFRLFSVYGPRQRPDLAISLFFRAISEGQPIDVFGDGSTSRDYTYIDDVVYGIMAGLENDHREHRLYNLGSGKPIRLDDLIGRIEYITGEKAIIKRQPFSPGDVGHTWADLTHSQKELGYEPMVSLDDGLYRQWLSNA
jgi:UDP-glucuronate 4-epimerase